MKKLLMLSLVSLILPFASIAMHTHESSSASLSKKPELTLEQEEKVANELNDRQPNKLSKLEVDNYRMECLNEHLLRVLSKLVLGYAPINDKYYLVKEIEATSYDELGRFEVLSTEKIRKLLNLLPYSNQEIEKILNLNRVAISKSKYSFSPKIRLDKGICNIIELDNESLVIGTTSHQILIYKLKNNQYYLDQTIFSIDRIIIGIIKLDNRTFASYGSDFVSEFIRVWENDLEQSTSNTFLSKYIKKTD